MIEKRWHDMSALEREIAVMDFMMQRGDPAYATSELASWARWPYADVRNALKRLERKGFVRGKTIGVGHMNQRIWWVMP